MPAPIPAAPRARPLAFVARTIRGVEPIAAAEILRMCGAGSVALDHREAAFTLARASPDLLRLGTVDDVFLVVAELEDVGRRREGLRTLSRVAAAVDAAAALAVVRTLRRLPARASFDVVASALGGRNYSRFDIEHAVGASIAGCAGLRYEQRSPARRPGATSLTLRVHLTGERGWIGVRLGDRPLHRRAYKLASVPGTTHPPLARCLALAAALRPGERLLDPFCGAGTIPIEAVLAAREARALGSDTDREAVAAARRNAAAAATAARFEVADARRLPRGPGTVDALVANPPWDVAVAARGVMERDSRLWRELGRVLAPGGRVILLVPPGQQTGDSLRAAGLEVALELPVAVRGRWATIVAAHRAGQATDCYKAFMPSP